jgi:hypothetical protein
VNSCYPSVRTLRFECDRCGKGRMVNESHAAWRDRALRDILKRMRHDGCGGRVAKPELLTGIDRATGRGRGARPDGPPRRRAGGPAPGQGRPIALEAAERGCCHDPRPA